MGNFHCIPSSCATVVYREYLPPVVRWQYPGEEWQEIEGDDYEIIDLVPKFNTTQDFNYTITAKAVIGESSPPPSAPASLPRVYLKGQIITVNITGDWSGGIYEFKRITQGLNVNVELTYLNRSGGNLQSGFCAKRTIIAIPFNNGKRVKSQAGSYTEPVVFGEFFDVICTPSSVPKTCIDSVVDECLFKVLSDGAVVHEETREDCPEVEVLPCRLDDKFKHIEINKLPFLDRVEVVPYEIVKFGLNVYRGSIPPECLNIYRNDLIGVIPIEGGIPLPYTYTSWQLIKQICSPPSCPPPEYDVVCECQPCESCPDGTCPIECGDRVCCYGSDGIAVKSIPLENYCDG